jgi:hypothetical protein
MKYSMGFKSVNNPKASFDVHLLEDSKGDLSGELSISIHGIKEDFSLDNVSAVISAKELNSLIGMLLQAQQNIRKNNG